MEKKIVVFDLFSYIIFCFDTLNLSFLQKNKVKEEFNIFFNFCFKTIIEIIEKFNSEEYEIHFIDAFFSFKTVYDLDFEQVKILKKVYLFLIEFLKNYSDNSFIYSFHEKSLENAFFLYRKKVENKNFYFVFILSLDYFFLFPNFKYYSDFKNVYDWDSYVSHLKFIPNLENMKLYFSFCGLKRKNIHPSIQENDDEKKKEMFLKFLNSNEFSNSLKKIENFDMNKFKKNYILIQKVFNFNEKENDLEIKKCIKNDFFKKFFLKAAGINFDFEFKKNTKKNSDNLNFLF